MNDPHSTDLAGARQHLIDNSIPDNDRPDLSLYVGRTVEDDWGLSLDQIADLIRCLQNGAAA